MQSNVSDVLPDGTVSSMPWRKAGVKYSQNEVYLDIVEEVDAIVGVNGQVRSSDDNSRSENNKNRSNKTTLLAGGWSCRSIAQ